MIHATIVTFRTLNVLTALLTRVFGHPEPSPQKSAVALPGKLVLVNESGTKSFFPKVEGRTERFGTRYRYDGLVKGEQGCETDMMASKKEKNAEVKMSIL